MRLLVSLTIFSLVPSALAQERTVNYEREIDPIFQQKCVSCHGPDRQENGLRMDTGEKTLLGGYNGPVVLPGMAAESSLMHFVLGIEEGEFSRMPMKAPPLETAEIELIRQWIDQGAVIEVPQKGSLNSEKLGDENAVVPSNATGHWAFDPVLNPLPPGVLNRTWARNPIDLFVLSRLESERLSPSAEADKATLFRRLSFDLTGLPPNPDEIHQFLKDNRPEAYQELVDRFLASPQFGERWALQWLDLARYADSDGYEQDRVRPWAWRYRDWVIEALNSNMPFDQFTLEQIAGDLVPNKTPKTLMATGFHRNSLINREGGTNREQYRFEGTVDRTNTVATVWMGLTVACAQCHDHKYDRISQKEYYQLFAFFNGLDNVNVDAPLPGELGPYLGSRLIYRAQRQKLLEEYGVLEHQPSWEQKLLETGRNPGKSQVWDKAYDALLRDSRNKGTSRLSLDNPRDTLEADPSTRTQREQDALTDHFIDNYRRVLEDEVEEELNFKELRQKIFDLYDAYPRLTQAQAVREREGGRDTSIHLRGQWNRKGMSVSEGLLGALPRPSSDKPLSRLELARWLVSRENPLTARVTVNRIWQELFGRGLVATSDDFGTRGSPPSHPQLLDWLATDFMDSDWRIKQIIRRIVTSATYRQSSKQDPDLVKRDPSNTLLARQARLRLKAELIRDAALTVSGLLERTIGGASVRPPQPKGTKDVTYAGSGKWPETYGPERYRRGLYIHRQRTAMYPFLQNFDIPDTTLTSCRREVSNSPLQALNLLNDPVFIEAAQTLAYRILISGNDSFEKRLNYAFQLSLARLPSTIERQRLRRYVDEQAATMTETEVARLFPMNVEGIGASRAAAWVGISSILLNLDEFITRE